MTQERFDAVIAGAGVTGLAAAVTLAEGGAKVVICEKQSQVGGTSVNFLGIFAAGSDMQRKKHIEYTPDEAFSNIMEYSHWLANPRLVRAIVDQSASTITWLQDKGVIFTDVVTNIPKAPQTYHMVQHCGADVVKALEKRARELKITINTSTSVNQIKKNADQTYDITIEKEGAKQGLTSNVVMISTGGYANNKEWIKRYAGLDLEENIFPVGNEGKMGEGIQMAYDLGAAEEGLGVLEVLRTAKVTPETMCDIGFAAVQPYLWVNQKGERFCDESVTFYDTHMGNVNVKQKNGVTFTIFSQDTLNTLKEDGMDKAMASDMPPGTKLVNLQGELDDPPDQLKDFVFKGETVQDLANKMKIDPHILEETISEYTESALCGHDGLFNKDPQYLKPLETGPFYAVQAQTVFLGTMGGIKISGKAEVLDTEFEPIPGLYAGGFDAGGMYGDSYGIKHSTGLASGFAVNSGRLAGRNALTYLGF